MSGITTFAINNSRFTVAFILLMMLAGIGQFLTFPRQEDPPIVIREAVVTVAFPGLVPARMEDLITRRVEAEIRTMPEIDDIKSETKAGLAVIHAVLTDEADNLQNVFQRLRNKMSDLAPKLPEGTQGPFVNDEFGLTAVATVALWSDGFTMAEMRLAARDIRDRLYELDGIRKVELFGVQDEEVTLKFSNARLALFGMSPGYLVDTLRRQNIVLPGGQISAGSSEILLVTSGNFESLEDIADTLIATP